MTRPDIQNERTAERAIKFLSTLSRNGQIRSILERGGYTAEEHQQGWTLLLALLGYSATPLGDQDVSSPSAVAIAELDQWDGPAFARARAALERKYPEQAAYVFAGLGPKSGAESIAAVRTFLDRIAALRTGSDATRKTLKAADKAAAALLAERRIIDAEVEAHLRKLIETAMTLAPASREPPASSTEDREQLAAKLTAWLDDWRETSRALVTRRDHQISLGLAQRRAAREGSDDGEDEATSAGANAGAPAAVAAPAATAED